MSDSVETTTPEAPSPTPAEPKAKGDELPEWARKKLSEANQEAANYRVQLREAQTALSTAQEQISTLTTDKASTGSSLSEVQNNFDKLAAAVQTLFPEDQHRQIFTFAKTLQGSNDEELASHAAELNKMFGLSSAPSPAVDRSQGLGGDSANTDLASQFAAFIQSNLTR